MYYIIIIHVHVGKPSALYDNLNPDWAPTLKLGHQLLSQSDTPDPAVQSRYDRARERLKRKRTREEMEVSAENGAPAEKGSSSDVCVHAPAETGTSCPTNLSLNLKMVASMESELNQLHAENSELKKSTQLEFTPDFFLSDKGKHDDEKVKYYTGLTNYTVLMGLFSFLESNISHTSRNRLSKFQQLLLTLIKLRLNLTIQDIAYRFRISVATASRTFLNIIDVLFIRLKPLVCWPDRDDL